MPNETEFAVLGSDVERDRSVEQFVQVFARHQRGIEAYIWTLVPNRADAEDIMQETSAALWRKWSDYDLQRPFFRWACGIAFVEVLRYRRKIASDKLWFTDELIETIAAEIVEQSELHELRFQALQSCLGKLDLRDRQILEARYREGATMSQLASQLCRPVSTLNKIVGRIRNRLHTCIQSTIAQYNHP